MVQLTTLLPFLLGTVLVLDPIFTAFTSLTLAWFLAACQSHGRARAMWLITLTWVDTGLPPHTTIKSLSAISRASTPRLAPAPTFQPASGNVMQKVEF
jgi:hypothetical protein